LFLRQWEEEEVVVLFCIKLHPRFISKHIQALLLR